MKTYEVTIRAVITKTYTVDGETEDEAIETAHSIFSVANETGVPEDYEQDTEMVVLCE